MEVNNIFEKHLSCGKTIRYAVSLYMSSVGSNCVASPFYIELLLNLLRIGASEETAANIEAMLPCCCTTAEVSAATKAAIIALSSDNQPVRVVMGNILFVNESYKIREAFKVLADICFFTQVERINFTKPPREHIVESFVKSRICDVFSKLVIWSSLHFKAKWDLNFGMKITNLVFYKTRQTATLVSSMTSMCEYDYYHCSELKAKLIKLKFNDNDGYMVIVCPDDIDGLGEVEENMYHILTLNPDHFQKTYINLEMPMFTISGNFDFGDFFHKIGLEMDSPDFSGIAGEKGELLLNKIIQSFSFTVDELGVENDDMCTELRPRRPNLLHPLNDASLSIVVDRPFAFFVQVKQVLLFAGRVVDPSYKRK